MIQSPEWMQDETISQIPPEKLAFLEMLAVQSQGKSQKEMLPFLLGLAKLSKERNISFTPEEFNLIIKAIEKNGSPEDIAFIRKAKLLLKRR